jgi:prophage regulatory protein
MTVQSGTDYLKRGSTMQKRYHSVNTLADRYEVSPATIWRWVRNKKFPDPVKLSPGCTRWSAETVEMHDAEREKGVAA